MRSKIIFPLILLVTASLAHADVIEISDDGEARILGVTATAVDKLDRAAGGFSEASVDDPFELAARRYGIEPNLLRAVAWTESRGRNDAVSPKGARGIMQLMPATAAELGVDPRDPLANINGGAAYLARQLATFHDVPLALAAYNAGPGAVIRYRGVPPYRETQNYVGTIMQRWSGSAVSHTTNTPSAFVREAGAVVSAPLSLLPKPLSILLIEVPGP